MTTTSQTFELLTKLSSRFSYKPCFNTIAFFTAWSWSTVNEGEALTLAAETVSNGSDRFEDSLNESSTSISSAETAVLGTRSTEALHVFFFCKVHENCDGLAPFDWKVSIFTIWNNYNKNTCTLITITQCSGPVSSVKLIIDCQLLIHTTLGLSLMNKRRDKEGKHRLLSKYYGY